MITTIFFDLDGTLIDQKTAQNCACRTLYKKYGFDAVVSEVEFLKKWDSLTELHYESYLKRECTYMEQRERRVADLFEAYGIDMGTRTLLEIYDEYLYYFEINWKAFPEIKGSLEALKEYSLGILTNGDSAQQKQKLETTGIAQYFQYIVCAGDYPYAKPDIRIFKEVCKIAKVAPSEILYVGDSMQSDINPCLSLGINCVYLNRTGDDMPKDVCSIRACDELYDIVSRHNKSFEMSIKRNE